MGASYVILMGIGALVWGGAVAVGLALWLDRVSSPHDEPGAYHAKALVACLPVVYLLLAWVGFVATVNRNSVTQMHGGSIFHYIPGLFLSVLPLAAYGKILLGPSGMSSSGGGHDHELEHAIFGIAIYLPLCVIAFILFSIWPGLLNVGFGWVRWLGNAIT